MPNTKEMIGKLIESIRSAHESREAARTLRFASGYIRAQDDFRIIITPEESREARAAIMTARSAEAMKQYCVGERTTFAPMAGIVAKRITPTTRMTVRVRPAVRAVRPSRSGGTAASR